MELKAEVKTGKKEPTQVKSEAVAIVDIKASAQNLINFLAEKGRIVANQAVQIKGVISNGNKCQRSFALFVGDKRYNIYRAIPPAKKGKLKGIAIAKGWGSISDESKVKYFNL